MAFSFKKSITSYDLKSQATSNIKKKEVVNKVEINTNFHQRHNKLRTKDGISNFETTKGTDWVAYINQNYFDSCGCRPRKVLFESITKRNSKRLFCYYEIRQEGSYCVAYCLYIIYPTKKIEIDFKSAVVQIY